MLTDPGFNHTLLTGFRDGLLAHGLEGKHTSRTFSPQQQST